MAARRAARRNRMDAHAWQQLFIFAYRVASALVMARWRRLKRREGDDCNRCAHGDV